VFNIVKGQSSTQLFTAKSDVYSYGILTFEVLSGEYPIASHRGAEMSNMPWHGLGMLDIFTSVARGFRPTPSIAAISDNNVSMAHVHEHLMQQCLLSDAAARPSFAELYAKLTA
jgi:serine/threonine protein kinase